MRVRAVLSIVRQKFGDACLGAGKSGRPIAAIPGGHIASIQQTECGHAEGFTLFEIS